MNNTSTSRSFGWLIGLILLLSWNLQAEGNPQRNDAGHLIRSSEFFKLLTLADDLPPLSTTATVGVPFSYDLPFLVPLTGSISATVTGLPANGLSVQPPGSSTSGFLGFSIGGVPLTSGVMNLTLINTQSPSGITAWRAITITVSPSTRPPISLTATVGVPFHAPVPFLLPLTGSMSLTVTGLPDNGLSLTTGISPSIDGIPLTSGVMNLTLVNTYLPPGNGMAWVPVTITVNPDTRPPISITATVGVPLHESLPFLLPLTGSMSVSVSGLPDNGLRFNGSGGAGAFSPTIEGVPLTSGVMNLTLVNTYLSPGSGTAWRPIIITVSPSTAPPISITATVGVPLHAPLPFLLPLTGSMSMSVSGLPNNGLSYTPGLFQSIDGVPLTSEVMNLTLVNTYLPPGIGTAWRLITITVNPSTPPTSTFSITGVTTVSCLTVTATERRLTFTPQYGGVTGQPISFSVVNEMLPTTSPGPYPLRLYIDNPTIILKAKQSGTAGEASFNYNWLAVCGAGSPPPPPTSTFSITGVTTVSCEAVTATERRLTFTPQYAGLNGQPVSFSVVNEMLPTTSPGLYTLRLYIDNPTITLKARQTGTAGEASFAYNWLAVCTGGGAPRLGVSGESTATIQVKVLGNPVREAIHVEVTGSENRSLQLSLTDIRGRIIGERRTEQAGASEHYRFDVSTLPAGPLLLRTSSHGQSETVRVLKVN